MLKILLPYLFKKFFLNKDLYFYLNNNLKFLGIRKKCLEPDSNLELFTHYLVVHKHQRLRRLSCALPFVGGK